MSTGHHILYVIILDLTVISGVPGELRGLEYVHKKYGALDWAKVMAPAIKVARQGWAVDERPEVHHYWNGAHSTVWVWVSTGLAMTMRHRRTLPAEPIRWLLRCTFGRG